MKRITLPKPPNPDDSQYKNAPITFARAQYAWMSKVAQMVNQASLANDTPLGQQFQVGAFTTNTSISGTSTGSDVANFVASLVTGFTNKGIISPNITIGDTQ